MDSVNEIHERTIPNDCHSEFIRFCAGRMRGEAGRMRGEGGSVKWKYLIGPLDLSFDECRFLSMKQEPMISPLFSSFNVR